MALSRKEKHDIKKAAELAPDFIMGRRPHSPSAPDTSPRMSHTENKKKMLLWFAVVTVTLFIIGLWFLNMRTLVYDVTNKKSEEGDIYRSVGQEASQIFSSFSIQDSINNWIVTTTPSQPTTTIETNIKKSLYKIAATAVTTTATSTVVSTTTAATSSAR